VRKIARSDHWRLDPDTQVRLGTSECDLQLPALYELCHHLGKVGICVSTQQRPALEIPVSKCALAASCSDTKPHFPTPAVRFWL